MHSEEDLEVLRPFTYRSHQSLLFSDSGTSSAPIPVCSYIQTWRWDMQRGPNTHWYLHVKGCVRAWSHVWPSECVMGRTCALFTASCVARFAFACVVVAGAGAVCHLMTWEGKWRKAEVCGMVFDTKLWLRKTHIKENIKISKYWPFSKHLYPGLSW